MKSHFDDIQYHSLTGAGHMRTMEGFREKDLKGKGCGKCVAGILFPTHGKEIGTGERVYGKYPISRSDFYSTPEFCECKKGQDLKSKWIKHPSHKEIDLCEKRIEAVRLLESSNIGQRFKSRTLESFQTKSPKTKALKKLAEDYVANWESNKKNGKGLFLFGNVGVGKTHIAAGVTQKLIYDHGVKSLLLPVPELLQRVRGSITDGGVEKMLNLYSKVELLVLDDIGTERVTEWVAEFLYLLVNARYEAQRPTIYTSNMSPSEIVQRMAMANLRLTGERIVDRIKETSLVVNIAIQESYRAKLAK